MASTVVSAWLPAMTRSLCPKCPVASNMIPVAVTRGGQAREAPGPAVRADQDDARRSPGCRAKIMLLRNEHRVPATLLSLAS
jgi:hypothetical protein